MTDGDCLLRAICAFPADDAPRGQYADWLDEYGEADRAAFIRCQIELARLPESPVTIAPGGRRGILEAVAAAVSSVADPHAAEREALRARERALWDAGSAAWFGSTGLVVRLNGDFGHPGPVGFVERGFVGRVECTVGQFLGGRCPHCPDRPGRQHRPYPGGWEPCPACVNGRTPGLAKGLAATCPVREIVLTDREPQTYELAGGRDGTVYGWGRGPRADAGPDEPFALPWELWKVVSRHPGCTIRGDHWADFLSPDAANAALSAAAVEYARNSVGLPSLREPSAVK